MSEYITEFFGSSSGGSYTERREPIVRCRDCKHYEDTGNCTLHYLADGCLGEVEPNGFCAWGERK